MFCSVVIPTIGRPTLQRAVASVLNQTFAEEDFEIVVANDSGQPLPRAEWQESARVRILNTNRRERSFARNSGAAIARGEYLYFLDDDDWLLSGALQRLWELARQTTDAVWLYGGIRVVDEAGACLAEVNTGLSGNCSSQIVGGAWVPIQASIVQTKAFFEVGGYDSSITGTEDQDLCRRLALRGSFANTPATVACLLRGRAWNTSTDYLRAPEDTRRSRDRVLEGPGAFSLLLRSADSSYWRGRLLRVYWSTALWNVRQGRVFRALSRTLFGTASLVAAGRDILSADYWRAARADHVPDTLHFVMDAFERHTAQNALLTLKR